MTERRRGGWRDDDGARRDSDGYAEGHCDDDIYLHAVVLDRVLARAGGDLEALSVSFVAFGSDAETGTASRAGLSDDDLLTHWPRWRRGSARPER